MEDSTGRVGLRDCAQKGNPKYQHHALSRIDSINKIEDRSPAPDESKRSVILHEFNDSPWAVIGNE